MHADGTAASGRGAVRERKGIVKRAALLLACVLLLCALVPAAQAEGEEAAEFPLLGVSYALPESFRETAGVIADPMEFDPMPGLLIGVIAYLPRTAEEALLYRALLQRDEPPTEEEERFLETYYANYDEEGRLLARRGQVEYRTTMKYIQECTSGLSSPSILEVGAGTGRYSIALAKEGHSVTAVELVPHNLDVLKSKLNGTEPITAIQGNALDLSEFRDRSFDLTMLPGPMYHLYTFEDKTRALSEAVRVTKPGGYILVAYCMNEPTIIQYVFLANHLNDVMGDNALLTDDWHCISEPKEIFELVRTEDISMLDSGFPLDRIKLVATDGAAHYLSGFIDEMDPYTFAKWMDYHLATCERQDLIGASNHTLDILKVRE